MNNTPTMNRLPISLLLGFACSAALAAPTPGPVRAEIDALLVRLQASGCEFNRNGSWYSGAEAKVHLTRKLEYLEGKSALQNTEQFIDLAASASSSSGKPYEVKCAGSAPTPSRQWLSRELATVRSSVAKGK